MSMAVIDHITSDYELMNQKVASQQLNDILHILAVRDHNQEPLICTIQKEVIQYGKGQDRRGQGNPDRQPSVLPRAKKMRPENLRFPIWGWNSDSRRTIM